MTREASGTLKELKGQDMIKHEKMPKARAVIKGYPKQ
jgi:hypothetical protein